MGNLQNPEEFCFECQDFEGEGVFSISRSWMYLPCTCFGRPDHCPLWAPHDYTFHPCSSHRSYIQRAWNSYMARHYCQSRSYSQNERGEMGDCWMRPSETSLPRRNGGTGLSWYRRHQVGSLILHEICYHQNIIKERLYVKMWCARDDNFWPVHYVSHWLCKPLAPSQAEGHWGWDKHIYDKFTLGQCTYQFNQSISSHLTWPGV